MIEDGSEDFRLIICPNNKRNADTLRKIILEHVELGTEIHTDCWRAYGVLEKETGLTRLGYIHRRVNHSDKVNRSVGSLKMLL